jgi:hypothetical protein
MHDSRTAAYLANNAATTTIPITVCLTSEPSAILALPVSKIQRLVICRAISEMQIR